MNISKEEIAAQIKKSCEAVDKWPAYRLLEVRVEFRQPKRTEK